LEKLQILEIPEVSKARVSAGKRGGKSSAPQGISGALSSKAEKKNWLWGQDKKDENIRGVDAGECEAKKKRETRLQDLVSRDEYRRET